MIPSIYWSTYDYSDADWHAGAPAHYRHIASHLVVTEKGFLIRKHEGGWTFTGKEKFAVSELMQVWPTYAVSTNGMAWQKRLDANEVRDYLAKAAVTFRGEIYLPMVGDLVDVNGGRYVNTWRDTRLIGDSDEVEACYPILQMILAGLTDDHRGLSMREMRWEIENGDSPFAWLINWLAAPYQYPGIRLRSNCWLVGAEQGVGKGVLVEVMKHLLGPSNVGKADQKEVEAGWTDHLSDCLLIEVDEFEDSEKKKFVKFIKEHTVNNVVSSRKRHQGPTKKYNCTHWLFMTNDRVPAWVEGKNRRDTFIQTVTRDVEHWKAHAEKLGKLVDSPDGARMLSGFAALLGSIEVRVDFAMKALGTALKQKLQRATISGIEQLAHDILGSPGRNIAEKIGSWAYLRDCPRQFPQFVRRSEFGRFAAAEYGLGSRTIYNHLPLYGVDCPASAPLGHLM